MFSFFKSCFSQKKSKKKYSTLHDMYNIKFISDVKIKKKIPIFFNYYPHVNTIRLLFFMVLLITIISILTMPLWYKFLHNNMSLYALICYIIFMPLSFINLLLSEILAVLKYQQYKQLEFHWKFHLLVAFTFANIVIVLFRLLQTPLTFLFYLLFFLLIIKTNNNIFKR